MWCVIGCPLTGPSLYIYYAPYISMGGDLAPSLGDGKNGRGPNF